MEVIVRLCVGGWVKENACGKNERLKDQLSKRLWPEEVNVVVRGFVNNMSDWMTAADLIVSKAGPGTIAEAMIRGLPIVLSGFLPGQEAPNVQYVTQTGVGQFSRQPDMIAEIVQEWVSNPSELEERAKISKSMGRPNATYDIVREIAKLCPELQQYVEPECEADVDEDDRFNGRMVSSESQEY